MMNEMSTNLIIGLTCLISLGCKTSVSSSVLMKIQRQALESTKTIEGPLQQGAKRMNHAEQEKNNIAVMLTLLFALARLK